MRVGSFWKRSAAAPAACGEDIEVPAATAYVAAICMHRSSTTPPSVTGGQSGLLKMLVETSGPAHWLIAAMTTPPGAEIPRASAPR